jgi:hypothetical protein
MLSKSQKEDIRVHFTVPPYIHACAGAVRYDLLYGPSWSRIPKGDINQFTPDCFATFRDDLEDDLEDGDVIEETYTGLVAEVLRGYIDDLPSTIWYDGFGGEVLTTEPEAYEDEILFGETIAREFK